MWREAATPAELQAYNAGWIYNCSSDVDTTATAENLTKAESLNGDYAGGIAGYNNGIIGNTKRNADGSNPSGSNGRIQTVCYIRNNYWEESSDITMWTVVETMKSPAAI